MANYHSLDRNELTALYGTLKEAYEAEKKKGLKLDLSRGKPAGEQLDLLGGMMHCLEDSDCHDASHDYRNYGGPTGIAEIKKLLGDVYGVPSENIVACGNSSLNLMYDALARCMLYGAVGGNGPWCREGKLKFLCPCPGYDRHFAVTQSLGFELIPVAMTETGPNMDEVEALVRDPAVKGIWCNPKYANPTGITYSDETVERLAKMETAANDFRIMWDNAYAVHDFDPKTADTLADIFAIAKKYGHEDRVLYFGSTSKITFPGAGVAFFAASAANLAQILPIMSIQTIGFDKLNQLRHVKYFGTAERVMQHMELLGAKLGKRFARVEEILQAELGDTGVATWTHPHGGYFVSFTAPQGCANRIYTLCKEIGVTLTGAGATYPYGKDPTDSNIRIAPTYPTFEQMEEAVRILTLCTKLAAVEKLLA